MLNNIVSFNFFTKKDNSLGFDSWRANIYFDTTKLDTFGLKKSNSLK